MSEPGWKIATVECRLCGHRHVSVYPTAIVDEERQQCSNCEHMTCGPVEPVEPVEPDEEDEQPA